MKNIKNILWFSLRSYKTFYGILLSILVALSVLDIFILNCSIGADLISFMSIITIVAFIFLIIQFCNEISKEQGRLLFMTPIKAWEFLSAKYILHTGVQIIIVASTSLVAFIGNVTLKNEIFITGLSLLGSFTIIYIIICSFIIIYGSFISNVGIIITLVTITSIILPALVGSIVEILLYFLPYFYLRIGIFEIDILFTIIMIALFGSMIYISNRLLDTKLDIN